MKQPPNSLQKIGLRVGHLSDAMDELGEKSNAGGGYQMLAGAGTIFGRAFTLRQMQVTEEHLDAPAKQGEAASRLAEPGNILVIDVGGGTDVATWGEAHTMRALANGLAGVVIHGATRDAEGIAKKGLPVICRGTSPVRSKGRLSTVEIGGRVTLEDVQIEAGDLIAFDRDGLIAVPIKIEAQVLEMAIQILEKEKIRDQQLEKEIRNVSRNG